MILKEFRVKSDLKTRYKKELNRWRSRKKKRKEKALTTEKTEKKEKIFATENEAKDGESLARSEA